MQQAGPGRAAAARQNLCTCDARSTNRTNGRPSTHVIVYRLYSVFKKMNKTLQ